MKNILEKFRDEAGKLNDSAPIFIDKAQYIALLDLAIDVRDQVEKYGHVTFTVSRSISKLESVMGLKK